MVYLLQCITLALNKYKIPLIVGHEVEIPTKKYN